ncbi:hypothetical protein NPX13_g2741 [Xylaria arbuscula]|uniref:Uncharacterized protein n=1 Tax=Xylaria arbuscula TaxID=114810 RepID=A0A9W8NJ76_9PEZI|nr:hypothetical protein NPX13_g2741 [Xylaria arbuscula]
MIRAVFDELMARRTPPGKPIGETALLCFWRSRTELRAEPKVKPVDMIKLGLENQVFSYVEERLILGPSNPQVSDTAPLGEKRPEPEILVPIRRIVYNAASY